MIKGITLQNYQKHDDLKVGFTEGLNVIVGQSDIGKSAIIRAFKWVVFNRPLGYGFRKFDTDFVRVKLDIDGTILERYKDKKDSYYKLNKEYYRAFGNEVPERINKLLNLKEVNFQFQFDVPFLISLTSSQINTYINNLVDLALINSCLDKVSKEIRSVSGDIKNTENNIKQLKVEYKQYKNLSRYYKIYAELEKENGELQDEISKCDTILNLLIKYEKLDKEINKYKNIDRLLKEIELIENKYTKIREELKGVNSITVLLNKYKKLNSNIVSLGTELDILNKTFNKLIDSFGGICPVCGNILTKECV